ncbi:aminotransferase class IV [Candidatus Mycalebacterium sp.]
MKNQRIYIKRKQVSDINGIFPRGVFYGDGVFETMRWKQSPPVFLQKHIERITRGALTLKMPAPDGKKIIKEIKECVKKKRFFRLCC